MLSISSSLMAGAVLLALIFAVAGVQAATPVDAACAFVSHSRRIRRCPSLWAKKPEEAGGSYDSIEASLTEKLINGGTTKRTKRTFNNAPRNTPSLPSVTAPTISLPKPNLPSATAPSISLPKPNVEGITAAAGPFAEAAALPAASLVALAALRFGLVSAKAKREEAQRRAQEEADKAKLLPQAGVLPVIDVPSLVRSGAVNATKTAMSSIPSSERAAKLKERSSKLNKELKAKAADLNKRQVALLKDRENKAVRNLGATVGTTARKTVKKVKEVDLKKVNLKIPEGLRKKSNVQYSFPKAGDLLGGVDRNTALAAAAGAAGLLAVFAGGKDDGAPDAPVVVDSATDERVAPPAPTKAVEIPSVKEEIPVKSSESAISKVPSPVIEDKVSPMNGRESTKITPSPSPVEKTSVSSSTTATNTLTNSVTSIKESSSSYLATLLPSLNADSEYDRDTVIATEAFGSLVLLAVAFRNAGAERRAAEDNAEKVEEDAAAAAVEPPPLEVVEGDVDGGEKTLLEKMSVDVSTSSELVQSIQSQIAEIDAKLASFGSEEVKELLRGQKRDLEEMLCFALDKDL